MKNNYRLIIFACLPVLPEIITIAKTVMYID